MLPGFYTDSVVILDFLLLTAEADTVGVSWPSYVNTMHSV